MSTRGVPSGTVATMLVVAEVRRLTGLRSVTVLGLAAVVSAMICGTSTAYSTRSGVGRIASVRFLGDPTRPLVVIRGSGLGALPPRNPPFAPSNKTLCRLRAAGVAGYDYGARLYIVNNSGKPVWRAGRYRPERELDCIGLVVLAFTPTTVRFRLGWAYAHRDYTPLRTGSAVQLVVNGASIRTRVRYSHPTLAELIAILGRLARIILRALFGAG